MLQIAMAINKQQEKTPFRSQAFCTKAFAEILQFPFFLPPIVIKRLHRNLFLSHVYKKNSYYALFLLTAVW